MIKKLLLIAIIPSCITACFGQPDECKVVDSLFKSEQFKDVVFLSSKILSKGKQGCLELYVLRGSSKARLGDHIGALEDYLKYLQSVKDHEYDYPNIWFVPTVYIQQGLSYLELGKREEACKSLSKAGEFGSEEAYNLIKQFCN